ncbi:MAG: hypothetical protein DIU68_009140 [Chloroflexota bacterium]|nr:MAG: hypothetical protein DIU68_02325 [Chloroflexota bacterium]
MRNYEILTTVEIDQHTGLLTMTASRESPPVSQLAMRREGDYVVISASYGPIEIALRPRYEMLRRTFARLQPIGGLQTTREIGTTHAYLSVGLRADHSLLLRPTLVGDASGHLCLNFELTSEVREALFRWLEIEP